MISDSVLFIHGCLIRRPVVGYLNRPEMASNRLCNTSIINIIVTFAFVFFCDICACINLYEPSSSELLPALKYAGPT